VVGSAHPTTAIAAICAGGQCPPYYYYTTVFVVGWALPTTAHDRLCYRRRMNETQLIQGRLIGPEVIEQTRALMIENPKWHRTRLSADQNRVLAMTFTASRFSDQT
jgi:hypothetical protein